MSEPIDPEWIAEEYQREQAELRQARLDEFARAVLPAVWAEHHRICDREGHSLLLTEIAFDCYQMAEAMLRESDSRAKGGERAEE